jgi:hypothetical protein
MKLCKMSMIMLFVTTIMLVTLASKYQAPIPFKECYNNGLSFVDDRDDEMDLRGICKAKTKPLFFN